MINNKNRETVLKIVVGIVAGLFALDRFVVSPAITSWQEQGERIASVRKKVQHGRQLIEREKSLRGRWAEMQRTDLPADSSAAESSVYQAIGRWTRESKVTLTSLNPQWRAHEDDGYDTLELRAVVTGDQASITRLLYEIGIDPLPARLEDYEISAKDARGQQLTLSARMTFLRLPEGDRNR